MLLGADVRAQALKIRIVDRPGARTGRPFCTVIGLDVAALRLGTLSFSSPSPLPQSPASLPPCPGRGEGRGEGGLKSSRTVAQPNCSHDSWWILDFSFEGSYGKWSRNGLRIDLPGSCWLIYAPFFEPEPLITVPGPTLAGNRPKVDQTCHLYLTFPI